MRAFLFLVSATALGVAQVEAGCGTPSRATNWCQEQGYGGAKTEAQCGTVSFNAVNCNYGSAQKCGCFRMSGYNWYNGDSNCKTPTSASQHCTSKVTCDAAAGIVDNCFCGGTASGDLCKASEGKECHNGVCSSCTDAQGGVADTSAKCEAAADARGLNFWRFTSTTTYRSGCNDNAADGNKYIWNSADTGQNTGGFDGVDCTCPSGKVWSGSVCVDVCDTCAAANKEPCASGSSTCGGCVAGYEVDGDACVRTNAQILVDLASCDSTVLPDLQTKVDCS